MTEREKIIKVIDEWANKAVKANKFDGASGRAHRGGDWRGYFSR